MKAILGTQWNPRKACRDEGNHCETSKDNLTDFQAQNFSEAIRFRGFTMQGQ